MWKKLALLTLYLVNACPLAAQSRTCGDLPEPDTALSDVAEYFTGPGQAIFRQSNGIIPLGEGAVIAVVTDSLTCATAIAAARQQMQTLGQLEHMTEIGYSYAVFQLGNYYAVLIEPQTTLGAEDSTLGHSELVVFQSSDMSYVATVVV